MTWLREVSAIVFSAWQVGRAKFLVALGIMIAGGASGPLSAVALATTIDAALLGHVRSAELAAVGAVGLVFVALTAEHFAHVFFGEVAEEHAIAVESETARLTQGSRGIALQQRPEFADRVEMLRNGGESMENGVEAVLQLVTFVIQVGITLAALARVEPVMALLPLCAAAPLAASAYADRLRRGVDLANGADHRRSGHIFDLATRPAGAREIRLFGVQEQLLLEQRQVRLRIHRRLMSAEVRGFLLRAAGQAVFAAGYVTALVLVVGQAVAGHRPVGDLVLVIALASQIGTQISGALAVVRGLQSAARLMGLLLWLRDVVADDERRHAAPIESSVPRDLGRGIQLVDVGFTYPGSHEPALADVNLRIAPGTVVAVVGENGAGKSTLVNLLCGLHEPTTGRITWAGTDLRAADLRRWRADMSAVFQDYCRYEFTVRECVGVGDLVAINDAPTVRAALTRAGGPPLFDSSESLETQLGVSYADGVDLSGGQWHRLALARGMMRHRPAMTFLDEPVEALDAFAEEALLRSYVDARHDARAHGGIVVLVSHRFSSARIADLIVVMAHGRIVEAGSHRELMATNGTYAELYSLQAGDYR